jgi:hypothetical protein
VVLELCELPDKAKLHNFGWYQIPTVLCVYMVTGCPRAIIQIFSYTGLKSVGHMCLVAVMHKNA